MNNFILNKLKIHISNYEFLKLPMQGLLMSDDKGYLYLKVNNNYVHILYNALNRSDIYKPQHFDKIGAHISVIYPEEKNELGL